DWSGTTLQHISAQRDRQHLIHCLHGMKAHRSTNFFRKIIDIACVAEWNDYFADLVAVRSNRFLLESTNRKHASAKRNLTSHCNIAAHRDTRERTDDSRRNR